ncbi:MAG: CPBP family intramembrane metalloprotease [Verrucomicrobia bacterium]|nr:CPBP family intramembrane metalloprotease [Verrucomicrobiota bacterium]
MIRWRLAFTLFQKEITETLRDRKTLLMAVGLPILLYPLIAMALTKLQESRAEAQEAVRSKIAVWGRLPGELKSDLERSNKLDLFAGLGLEAGLEARMLAGDLPPIPSAKQEDEAGASESGRATNKVAAAVAEHPLIVAAQALVGARKADAVLVLDPQFQSQVSGGGLARVHVLYDSVRDASGKAQERLSQALEGLRKQEVVRREKAHGLPPGFSKALQVQERNLAPKQRRTGKFLGSILPFLLIVLSASGGLYATIDLTAGEKERNTLQTLLCAPLTGLEIIVGKFFAAWVIVLITTLANLASMAATFARIFAGSGGFQTSVSTYALAFLVLLPATFMLTAIFLSIAVFARDFKDGQNLLTPMFMLLTMPLGATMLPDVELNVWTSAVPLVNIALLMKGVFIAEAKPELIFFTLLSSVLYAGLALSFAARVFQQEQVLLGGRDSWKGLFRFSAPIARDRPSPAFAWTAFAAVFVMVFYVSQLLQGANTIVAVLATQYGFFLLPNALMAWRWRFSAKDTYLLRRPALSAVIGAILIGFSAWGVTAGLVTRIFPPPESFAKGLEKVLLFEGMNVPLIGVWLLLGATPAICEELFFRGLIMGGFRGMGRWPAWLLSSLLFAVAHSSIYRLLPTFTLGMIIAFCAWRSRSIFTGMIIHAINNSLLVTVLHKPEWFKKWGFSEMTYVPWSWGFGLASVMGLGMFFVARSGPKDPVAAEKTRSS